MHLIVSVKEVGSCFRIFQRSESPAVSLRWCAKTMRSAGVYFPIVNTWTACVQAAWINNRTFGYVFHADSRQCPEYQSMRGRSTNGNRSAILYSCGVQILEWIHAGKHSSYTCANSSSHGESESWNNHGLANSLRLLLPRRIKSLLSDNL